MVDLLKHLNESNEDRAARWASHAVRDGAKIILLGAGASFGSAVSPRPPIIKDFFQRGRTLCDDSHEELFELIQQLGYSNSPNLEMLFSHFEALEFSHTDSGKSLRAEFDIQTLWASPSTYLLYFALEVLRKPSIAGIRSPCPRHTALARSLSAGDAVISLNYDLIGDAALRANARWNEFGYGPGYDTCLIDDCEPASVDYVKPQLSLLKPHGSLNFKRDGSSTKIQALHKFASSDYGLNMSTLRKWATERRKHLGPASGPLFQEQRWQMVPPTRYKLRDRLPEELKLTWLASKATFARARQIVVVGYSFAESDTHINVLFQSALRRRSDVIIQVVDCDPSVVDRISHLIGNNTCTLVASRLEDYVSQLAT